MFDFACAPLAATVPLEYVTLRTNLEDLSTHDNTRKTVIATLSLSASHANERGG